MSEVHANFPDWVAQLFNQSDAGNGQTSKGRHQGFHVYSKVEPRA